LKAIDQYQLAYEVQGKGIPLVFLHGFCEDSSMWEEALASGIDGYQFIFIDLPGFGNAKYSEAISIEGMAQNVLALLSDLKINQFVPFGHSMGGYVALSLMQQAPEKLLGFGLVNSHPYADTELQLKARQKSIDFINQFGSTLYLKQLIPNLFPKSFVNSNRFLLEKLIFAANRIKPEAITNAQWAMKNRVDQVATLKASSVPVFSLIGKKDDLIPLEKNIEQSYMAKQTDFHLVKNSGHMSSFEKPAVLRAAILNYLRNFVPLK